MPCRPRPWERGKLQYVPHASGKGFGDGAPREKPTSVKSRRKVPKHDTAVDGSSDKVVHKTSTRPLQSGCTKRHVSTLFQIERGSRKATISACHLCQAVERAIRAVEGRKARPVDATEAAKGRWDYAKVKDWGSGQPEDLDRMEVTSFTSGSPFSSDGESQPFYNQLARRLAELEASSYLAPIQSSQVPCNHGLPLTISIWVW